MKQIYFMKSVPFYYFFYLNDKEDAKSNKTEDFKYSLENLKLDLIQTNNMAEDGASLPLPGGLYIVEYKEMEWRYLR